MVIDGFTPWVNAVTPRPIVNRASTPVAISGLNNVSTGDSFELQSNSSVVALHSGDSVDSQLSGLRKIIAAHIKATFSYFW
jgi:hypothetical protein